MFFNPLLVNWARRRARDQYSLNDANSHIVYVKMQTVLKKREAELHGDTWCFTLA